MTDEELEETREALEEIREYGRKYLTEKLGGKLDDYRHDVDSCSYVLQGPNNII